jgi:glycosyltransferase involved in cell wall biosynthesis
MRKLRVFFLSFYPPTPTMGGAMAYYRHFVERTDFELFVATDDTGVRKYDLGPNVLVFKPPKLLERLMRTRLSRWAHSYKHLAAGRSIPAEVLAAAEAFQPDVIFTIAGSWGWTAMMARQLAKKMQVPLVGSFNDWFDYSIIIHPALHGLLHRTFRRFYEKCDLAICTCEGMRDALGPHQNAVVLYPCGAADEPLELDIRDSQKDFKVTFGGNLGLWYGEMLESLIRATDADFPDIRFSVFGTNASWSDATDMELRSRGIFRGLIPFRDLQHELRNSDCLLLEMGFGAEAERVERTSFKTKFLDYLTVGRPIAVWGPEYCSAVTVAREFDAAEVCTDPDPYAAAKMLDTLRRDPKRQQEITRNARQMYFDRFHPDRIHELLCTSIERLVHQSRQC